MCDQSDQRLVINITGQYKVGNLGHLTHILSRFPVQILDLGQASIHNNMNLSVLVRLSGEADTALMLKDLVFAAADLSLHIEFKKINDDHQLTNAPNTENKRFILTLVTGTLLSIHLSPITEAIDQQQLEIVRINRLSKRQSSQQPTEEQRTCIEFILEGQPQDLSILRSTLLDISQTLDIDIAFQQDTPFRRNRRLVCFDMDSTLIEAEVIDELAKAAGVGDQVAAITHQAMQGTIDFDDSFKQRLALLKGLPEHHLASIATQLKLTEGAERLIQTVRALGYKTAILSGGFSYFGKILQDRLNIDYMFANELEIENGQVTGRVIGPIVNGQRKAQLLAQLTEELGINKLQVIAVGDGANDLPMLDLAGLGIAFKAKPLVKASAKQAISHVGLDGILYLMGVTDDESHSLLNQA